MRINRLVPQWNRYSSASRAVGLLALCGFLLCLIPALASADVQTIDFDSGALNAPLDGQGDVSFPKSFGFRPYRTEVGAGRAHSGTTVGDLGRCAQETGGGDASGCEFFQAATKGVLSRTANSVTLFAGRLGPIDPTEEPEQAILRAFDANGNQIAGAGPVELSESFTVPLEVTSPTGSIASFRVEATQGANGESNGPDLGVDDVMVNFADGGVPDFSVSTTNQVVAVVQGQETQVPVQLSRLNGSSGPIELTVTGLPKGVSASPVTVEGTQSAATLTLNANPSAADTDFHPIDATITADPLGNGNVAPAPRTAPLAVRVATDFALSVNGYSKANPLPFGRVRIEAPDCAPVEVPFTVSRDITMSRDVSLSLRSESDGSPGLGPGVDAEFLPDPVVPPGGNLVAHGTLRFRVDPEAHLGAFVRQGFLVGTTDASAHTLPIELARAAPRATVEAGALGVPFASTPRFGKSGTRVRVHGAGFCRGTQVEIGNEGAVADTTFVNNHTLEFSVPRYATSGPITIVPPASLPSYQSENSLIVDSVRNSDGFQFANPGFRWLSLGEFTKAFGEDDLFVSVNPCWPFGDCSVKTGFLNPVAEIEWGVLNQAAEAHCFAMNLASLQLTSGKEPYRQFTTGNHVYDLPGHSAPSRDVESLLDAYQVRQFSSEFLLARLHAKEQLKPQLETLEREFAHNREVMVSIKNGSQGHSLLAYDMVQSPGDATIYVYDPNRPFFSFEDISGTYHREVVDLSAIRIDKVKKTWEFALENGAFSAGQVWGGGEDGSLWAVPNGTSPQNPSLPDVGTLYSALKTVVYGSKGGSVRAVDGSRGAEFLPSSEAVPGGGSSGSGAWVTDEVNRPLDVTFEGLKGGSYSQAYTAPGFIASATVATAKGVRDVVKGGTDSLSFESGSDRALRLQLARSSGATTSTAASLDTHASAAGSDTAGIADDGALTYAHEGSATTLRFSLTTVRPDGGPATFASGPVRIGRGEQLRAKPLGRDLRRVRLVLRDAHGRERTRVLRNRGRSHARLAIAAPKVSGHRVSVRTKLSGVRGRVVLGATLRLMRGSRLVASRAVALRKAAGRIVWRLPHDVSGRYRLLADVRGIATGAPGSTASTSVSARRAASVKIGR